MSLSPEDKIIIWIISIGIFIGLFLYIGGNVTGAIRPSPILVSVFLGIGLAAAIYRFLGGLTESGMQIGPAKLAGTAAAFLAFTWFLNGSLEKQWINGGGATYNKTQFSITPDNWFALDKYTGNPVQVEIRLQDSVITSIPAEVAGFPNRPLTLDRSADDNGNFVFSIKAAADRDTLLLGGLSQSELSKNKLFRSFSDTNSNLFTSDLVPPGREIDLAPELPFRIRTGVYSQDYTRFALVDDDTGEILIRSNILLRAGKIFEVKDRLFLIMVTQVNHTRSEEEGGQYAKFGVIELQPDR